MYTSDRLAAMVAALGLLLGSAAYGQGVSAPAKAPAPAKKAPAPECSPDEPIAKDFSLDRAAAYLDKTCLDWTRQRKCGSCHTTYPYLMARPALKGDSPAYAEVRKFFDNRASHWDTAKPIWPAEVICTAAALAINDAHTDGKLRPLTRQALDRMWKLQRADGGWEWLRYNNAPMEHDDYFGALQGALGAGHAGLDYQRSEPARTGLEKLRGYFKKTAAPDLHHRTMLLWAAQRVEGLMTTEEKQATVKQLLALQHPDGGWSLPSLGSWKRHNGKPNDPAAPSDGYATGLVVFVLREAGMPASDEHLRRGAAWLRANQRVGGSWFTRSLNNDQHHFIAHAGTAFAVLALTACEESGR
jgi:squalene-hopene/tetraprenyl-beta-curcumene cyclase